MHVYVYSLSYMFYYHLHVFISLIFSIFIIIYAIPLGRARPVTWLGGGGQDKRVFVQKCRNIP